HSRGCIANEINRTVSRTGWPLLVDASDGHRQRGPRHYGKSPVRGTDIADGGADLDARVAVDWRLVRRHGRIHWRTPRRSNDADCRCTLLASLRHYRHSAAGIAARKNTDGPVGGIVF